MISIAGILVLVVTGLTTAVGLGVFRRNRAIRPVRTPVCAGCRYSVVGLAAGPCPECGWDLEDRGVIDAGDPKRPGRVAAAAVATLIPAAILLWTIALIGLCGLEPDRMGDVQGVTLQQTGGPAGAAGPALTVERRRSAAWSPGITADDLPPGTILVRRPASIGDPILELDETEVAESDAEALAGRLADALRAARPPVNWTDTGTVADVMRFLAIDAAGPDDLQAGLLRVIAEAGGTTGGTQLVATGGSSGRGRARTVWPAVGATGIVVALSLLALAGIRRTFRRSRPVPISTLDPAARAVS